MLKQEQKTATSSWSPSNENGFFLVLGTVAGALDASFSSKTELEILDLNLNEKSRKMKRVAATPSNARFNRISWGSCGQIACGKENGEMDLYDAKKLLKNAEKPLNLRTNNHSGPVRGLHFNPTQTHLLASGATDGEILIWDMNQLSKPYAPGPKSQRLEDVTCLAWNKEVSHIFASGSSNGYTVVWDLRSRKELIKIPYPGGRKPVTSICWNPDKPTQMITCSDDDANPVILSWDLRNASAAEKTMSGHTKGILSMDWCPKDSELLLSCGKDNRTIVWNTTTGEPIGDLAHSSNWSFDVKWCPRNPDLCVVSSFDGKVALHSIQNTSHEEPFSPVSVHAAEPNIPSPDPNDPFAQIGVQDHSSRDVSQPSFALPHPPKWLRRPVGAVWGFGGKLAYFDSMSANVVVQKAPINREIADRADTLDFVLQQNNPDSSVRFCDYVIENTLDAKERDIYLFLKRIFLPASRDNMCDFVGYDQSFSSDEKLAKLVKKLNIVPDVPAEISQENQGEEGEVVPSKPKPADPFSFYSSRPGEENETDTLVTKAVIVGDFELAVNVCLGAGRFADAFVLASFSGPELVQRVQDEYFKKNASSKAYIRALRSIAQGDLNDLIANAKLDSADGWRDLVAMICTYAKPEKFSEYFSVLGSKLMDPSFAGIKDKVVRNHVASLCFIGSGEIEKIADLWCPDMKSDTKLSTDDQSIQSLAEKISLIRQAVQFQDPALSLEASPEETERLKNLYNSYIKYAWVASVQGSLDIAWRFLENVPLNFIPSLPIDIVVLRDRVYASRGHVMGVTGQPPLFPFEFTDVIDGEALRIAAEYEEKQRLLQQQKFAAQQNSYQHQQHGSFHQQHSYQQQVPNQASGYGSYPQQNSWQQPHIQNQPPVANQWQQPAPPVVNQWQQPPPVSSNQWQQQQQPWVPQQSAQVIPPPPIAGATGHAPPMPSSHFQPPVHSQSQANMFQPAGPQMPPPISGATGHAPPMPSTHYQPPTLSQAQRGSFSSPNAPAFPPSTVEPPPPVKPVPTISNPGDKACYDHIVKLLALAKTKNADKKSMDEADKKIDVLFEAFCTQKVPSPVVSELEALCNALDQSKYTDAKRQLTDLMSKRFDVTGQWIVGVKRIVDALDRSSRPAASLSPQNTSPARPGFASGPPPPVVYGRNPAGPPPPPSGYAPTNPIQRQPVGPPPTSFGYQPQTATRPPPPLNSNQASIGAPPINGMGPPPPVNQPKSIPPPLAPPPINGPSLGNRSIPPTSQQLPPGANYQNGSAATNGYQQPRPPTNGFSQQGPPQAGFNAPRPGFGAPPPLNGPSKSGFGGPPSVNGPPVNGPPQQRYPPQQQRPPYGY